MENSEYKAKHITILRDLEAVKKRPSMFIGDTSIRGLHHIIFEAIDNSLDEAMNGFCDNIKLLWQTEPQDEAQAKAKDFWFFSYYAYGMNTRDVCELKHSSINNENIFYERAKTKSTKKNQTIKQVPITSSLRNIINRRKSIDSKFLFGVLNEKDSPLVIHNKIKLFNNFINNHFRKFAAHAGIDKHLAEEIGTYHARHSFATIAIRNKNSFELISEILHDGNLKTTQNYINSFPKESYTELSQGLEIK